MERVALFDLLLIEIEIFRNGYFLLLFDSDCVSYGNVCVCVCVCGKRGGQRAKCCSALVVYSTKFRKKDRVRWRNGQKKNNNGFVAVIL